MATLVASRKIHLSGFVQLDAIARVAAWHPNAMRPKRIRKRSAALPIGGRVKTGCVEYRLELIKSKPIGTVAEREEDAFEVTPFMPLPGALRHRR